VSSLLFVVIEIRGDDIVMSEWERAKYILMFSSVNNMCVDVDMSKMMCNAHCHIIVVH
jgi:hypothetical protein